MRIRTIALGLMVLTFSPVLSARDIYRIENKTETPNGVLIKEEYLSLMDNGYVFEFAMISEAARQVGMSLDLPPTKGIPPIPTNVDTRHLAYPNGCDYYHCLFYLDIDFSRGVTVPNMSLRTAGNVFVSLPDGSYKVIINPEVTAQIHDAFLTLKKTVVFSDPRNRYRIELNCVTKNVCEFDVTRIPMRN